MSETFDEGIERRLAEAISRGLPDDQIEQVLTQTLDRGSDSVLEELRRRTPAVTRALRRDRRRFERRLRKAWGRSFDEFELVRNSTLELGDRFVETARGDQNFRTAALIRLHGRSCRVTSQVGAMLRTGHADGAMAGARTLHEHAVVALVIKDHDEETAERYLLHGGIEAMKRANAYQTHAVALGEEPFSDGEIEEIRENKRQLVERFEKSYASDYGWAAHLCDGKAPTFQQLEHLAGLAHERPYYRWFSGSAHAGSKEVAETLRAVGPGHEHIIDAGPGFVGLADPAISAMRSLYRVTVALLLSRETPLVSDLLALQSWLRLKDSVEETFLEHHRMVEAAAGEAE